MTILCGIGLPGFAVSIALTVVAVSSTVLSLVIIDKVSGGNCLNCELKHRNLLFVNTGTVQPLTVDTIWCPD